MLALPGNIKVFIANSPVDMRRSHDGLAALAEKEFNKNVLSGNLFVFFNRHATRVKVLYWDRNGYCLWYKRLEKGHFHQLRMNENYACLNMGELNLLLEGVDLTEKRLRSY